MRTILAALLLVGAGLGAAEYHVASDGSDANDGSPTKPFATLQRGADLLQPGDTLVVAPGVYRQTVRLGELHGEPERPITLRASLPRTVFMIGSRTLSGWRRASGVRETYMTACPEAVRRVYERDTNREYVEMADLYQVEDTAAAFMHDHDRGVIYVHTSDDADPAAHLIDACVLPMAFDLYSGGPANWQISLRKHVVIDGFVMAGYDAAGVHLMRGDSCEVRNCVVHHCGAGIFMHSSIRSVIRNCRASWCYDRNDNEGGGIAFRGRDYDNVIADCVVHDVMKYGIRHYGGGFLGCEIRNCLAYRIGRCAIHTKGAIDTTGRHANMFTPPPSERPLRVYRNVAVEKAHPHTVLFDCWGMRANTVGASSVSYRTGVEMAAESQLTFEPDSVAELRFADPVNHDYRLQSDSPARGQDKGAFRYAGDVFFVGNGGDNGAAGTSVATAWGDVAVALSRLQPGQTLYVLAGTYALAAALDLGGGVIAIRARGEDAVVFEPARDAPGLSVTGAGRLELERLRFSRFVNAAVEAGPHAAVAAERCVFDRNGAAVALGGTGRFCRSVFYANRAAVQGTSAGAQISVYGTILWRNRVAYDRVRQVLAEFNCVGGGDIAVRADRTRLPDIQTWREFSGQDLESLAEDPRLAAPEAGDFHLEPTSPGRGRGWEWGPVGIEETPHHWFEAKAASEIVDVTVPLITPTMANLTWRSRGGKTTVLVRYGTAKDRLDQRVARIEGQHLGSFHAVTLFELRPETTYFYQLGSAPYRLMYAGSYAEPMDPGGPVWDPDVRSFRTPASFAPRRRTLHVSKALGSDANDGLAADRAFATVHKASRVAEPGDRVVVHAGEYFGLLRPVNSGLPEAPIVFEAAAGERVVLSGKRLTQSRSVVIFDKRHVVLRGFVFKEHCKMLQDDVGGGSQVMIGDSRDISVQNCLFDGRMYYMMSTRIFRSADVRFTNNVYYIMSNYTGVSIGLNDGRIVFDHNTFYTGATTLGFVTNNSGEVVFSNNIFGEKIRVKWTQPKFNLFLNQQLAFDHNYYAFAPENKTRFALRLSAKPGVYVASAAVDPAAKMDQAEPGDALAVAREWGLERHGRAGPLPWLYGERIAAKSRNVRGIAPRDRQYKALEFADFAVAPDAPCRGLATDGGMPGRRPGP